MEAEVIAFSLSLKRIFTNNGYGCYSKRDSRSSRRSDYHACINSWRYHEHWFWQRYYHLSTHHKVSIILMKTFGLWRDSQKRNQVSENGYHWAAGWKIHQGIAKSFHWISKIEAHGLVILSVQICPWEGVLSECANTYIAHSSSSFLCLNSLKNLYEYHQYLLQ